MTKLGMVIGNIYGRGDGFYTVSHAIAFAQMRRAVCQRQRSFLLTLTLTFHLSAQVWWS